MEYVVVGAFMKIFNTRSSSSSSSSSSVFVQIKVHDANKVQMIKPEQDRKVEKPHLLLPLNRKRNKTQNLHNTLQLNTMEENITVIKTTMGVLAKDQVALKVNLIYRITMYIHTLISNNVQTAYL